MLTLGMKEIVINTPQLSRVKVLNRAGTEIADAATEAAKTATDGTGAEVLHIDGSGTFNLIGLGTATGLPGSVSRAVDPNKATFVTKAGVIAYTAPTVATTLVIEMGITSPRSTTSSGRNFIQPGDSIVLEVRLGVEDTDLKKAFDKVVLAFEDRAKLWDLDTEQFTVVAGGTDTATATLSITGPDIYTDIEFIKFLSSTEGNRPSLNIAPTEIRYDNATYVTSTPAFQGEGTGEYLLECVKMPNEANTDIYNVHPGETPIPGARYTTCIFDFASSNYNGTNVAYNFDGQFTKQHQACLYIQEPGMVGDAQALPADSVYESLMALFANVDVATKKDGTTAVNATALTQLANLME